MSLWGSYLEELLDVSFNGVSFQSVSGGQVTDHNFDEMPDIRASKNPISSAHRSITAGRFFITKQARVNIAVEGEFHQLQAILGRFRQLIQYRNRDLVLTRGVPILNDGEYELTDVDESDAEINTKREITFRSANVVAADMNHNAAKGTVITIEFTIDDPIGISGTPQIIYTAAGRTASSTAIDLSAIDLQGTFQEQYPIYKIKINSLTNGSSPSFKIVNGLSEIVIAQQFAAADELIIDTDEMKVKLNGELIDFTGSFPFIADPNSTITISDTLSARNIDIEVKINSRYI